MRILVYFVCFNKRYDPGNNFEHGHQTPIASGLGCYIYQPPHFIDSHGTKMEQGLRWCLANTAAL